MTTEPTADEIEAAARALCGVDNVPWDCFDERSHGAWRRDARDALTAALPLVEARLREQIAADIEAAAPPAEPEIGRALYGDDMYGNGMRAAARIARRGR